MQLTPNFTLKEFRCKDGTDVPDAIFVNVQELADNLQVLRDSVGKPITVISGYRTPEYNQNCGGAPLSQHLTAKAGDLKASGMTSDELHAAILELIDEGKMKQGGVGLYPTFVHYDIRGTKARWGA